MKEWKVSFLIAVLTVIAFAQTTPPWDTREINAIAAKLNCNCGCKQHMDCQMQPGCPECKRNKQKMMTMLQSDMNESQILDQFVKEQGKDVLVVPPGSMGVVGPYVALTIGLGLVILVMRRYLRQKPAPVPEVDQATLDKIEKETANLD
ncbi:MAG: cytochrome c-type biogenesis protein CcmH [Bryobacterales bacterium]|nr:cytochrome c-type biogenesis protein CcmH [Bryobacterales bacterium]MBV9400511.1 cytochrome c-type biogenesis protein CcmH [Bryobacterales bacterium]